MRRRGAPTVFGWYCRLYDWKAVPNSPIQDALARQQEYVRLEFENRLAQASWTGAHALRRAGSSIACFLAIVCHKRGGVGLPRELTPKAGRGWGQTG